ncbi:50S ribosomal protein L29 [bacterium]|nr:MAG: 50S ribosomal protein L29 [bacterium]
MSFETDNFRKKNITDLSQDLFKRHEQLRRIRFDMASNQVKNVKEVKAIKKEIAQILTELSMRKNHGE